ncbi:MAG: hypothetical protein P4M08_15345 [Oligoflexia bacterium]|nr:hypothetical protein [Oligoflexia bacterium]
MEGAKVVSIQPRHFWFATFGLWLFFLSGVLTPFFGTPGAIQALRLRHILETKQEQIAQHEDELLRLQTEADRLEKSRVAQQIEIRRVLGYAAPNELIFDFRE